MHGVVWRSLLPIKKIFFNLSTQPVNAPRMRLYAHKHECCVLREVQCSSHRTAVAGRPADVLAVVLSLSSFLSSVEADAPPGAAVAASGPLSGRSRT